MSFLKRCKSLIVAATMTFVLATAANAIVPALAFTVVVSEAALFKAALATSVAAHAGVISFFMSQHYARENGGAQPQNCHSVDPTSGNIGRNAIVEWVDLKDPANPIVNKKDVTAKVSYNNLKSSITPSKPNLYNALNPTIQNYQSSSTIPLTGYSNVYTNQTVKASNGLFYRLNSQVNISGSPPNSLYFWPKSQYPSGPSMIMKHTPDGEELILINTNKNSYDANYWTSTSTGYRYTQVSEPAPILLQSTPANFYSSIKNPLDNSVRTEFRGEIDDFIKSNPNIVEYKDSSISGNMDSAPSYSPPLPSQSQIDQYAILKGVSDAASSASAAAKGAKDAAAAAAGAALSRYQADPSLENQRAYQDALARQKELEQKDKEAEQGSYQGSMGAKYEDGKDSADFGGRLNSFVSDMKGTALFSAPATVFGTCPPGSPTMDVNLGRFGSTPFDASRFNSLWSFIRILVIFACGVTSFYIVTLKGGSG